MTRPQTATAVLEPSHAIVTLDHRGATIVQTGERAHMQRRAALLEDVYGAPSLVLPLPEAMCCCLRPLEVC